MKMWIGVLVCFLVGCANIKPKTTIVSESDSERSAIALAEDTVVDQSAGLQIMEALSKAYGDEPNVIGEFIGSPRCPSFLEGMFFDGPTLVFQVRGDTVQARRTLETAAGSKAFRLEQVTEQSYSQQQLKDILDELSRRYDSLTDKRLKSNMCSWGMGLRYIEVRFILNTPQARQAFREKLMDSPAIRFEGPEQPIIDEHVGITDTLGISLQPEYSVFSADSPTASFVLLNQGNKEIMCGEHYSVTYEDPNGTWRKLPINDIAIDIGYVVLPGGHKIFTAGLYPDIHPNKPGRYRFFYEVMLDAGSTSRRDILMMAEFRLTDNKQEVKNAIRMKIPEKPDNYGAGHIPASEHPSEGDAVYEVVEEMPEYPGGMPALLDFIRNNLQHGKASSKARVIVQFIIDEGGNVVEPVIVRTINPEVDKEALRVVGLMSKWKPGKQYGKAKKVKYTIPVTFDPSIKKPEVIKEK